MRTPRPRQEKKVYKRSLEVFYPDKFAADVDFLVLVAEEHDSFDHLFGEEPLITEEVEEVTYNKSDYSAKDRVFIDRFLEENRQYIIDKVLGYEPPRKSLYCCTYCGRPLTEVRPGKHQCDNKDCEENKEKTN